MRVYRCDCSMGVEICYTYLNRIVPKCVHILADSSINRLWARRARIRSLLTPKRRVYDYIINHTFEKQPWQPEYDMRITWEGSVEICYDIITHTSKPPWQSVERVCITWGSVEICYTYLNRIVPKRVHILADSSINNGKI